MRLAYLAAVPVLAAGCGNGAPENPTWVADVQPILLANCVRCHGDPTRGGAPTTFRLDVYKDTAHGSQRIYGANSMSGFVINRVVKVGDHPPIGPPLDGTQKDTLENWSKDQLGTRENNAEPAATLVSPPAPLVADTSLTLDIQVDDGDGEPVVGELRLQGVVEPIAALRDGRQQILWVSATVAPGAYTLQAHLEDAVSTVDRDLGMVTVAHDTGNTAPRLAFDLSTVFADQIVGPEGPVTVAFSASDADAADIVTVSFEAFQGDTVVPLEQNVAASAGETTLDPTGIPAGTHWRLRAIVSDGKTTTIVESETFIVSHATTRYGFTDVLPQLKVCAFCHKKNFGPTGGAIFDIQSRIEADGGPEYPADELPPYRGRAWRKVVQTRDMPPTTLAGFLPSDDELMPHDLSEEERASLGEWLLAGAPEFATAPPLNATRSRGHKTGVPSLRRYNQRSNR